MISSELLRKPKAVAAATVAAIGFAGIWSAYAYTGREMVKTEFIETYLDDDGCLRNGPYGGAVDGRLDVDGVAFPGRTTLELAPNQQLIAREVGSLRFIITPDDGPGFRFEPADKGTQDILNAYRC